MQLLSQGFWSDGDCFLWNKKGDKNGYGNTTYTQNKVKIDWRVTRLIWTLTNGDIPENMLICHTCDNPKCFNLDHLFLGTHQDNSQDRDLKGRARIQIGEKNHMAVLSEDIVLEIRKSKELGMKNCDIARKFGLRQGTVSKILLRTRWKHI